MQAQHDSEAARLVQAVRAAACLPLLALPPTHRTPQRLTLLSHLTSCLQVFPLLPGQTQHISCMNPFYCRKRLMSCTASAALLCVH